MTLVRNYVDYRDNALRLLVYYEDLNYERLHQERSYTVSSGLRFIACRCFTNIEDILM